MQKIYDCKFYTPNENLNKTCDDKKRCLLIEESNCYDYAESDLWFWNQYEEYIEKR